MQRVHLLFIYGEMNFIQTITEEDSLQTMNPTDSGTQPDPDLDSCCLAKLTDP